MCYAYKFILNKEGKAFKVQWRDFKKLEAEGKVSVSSDGYHYAKDTVEAIRWKEGGQLVLPMRWDLIPGDFLKKEKLTLAEAVKKKNSRAKNPATGKSWGYSSFNARLETIAQLWSFRNSWHGGRRCLLPVDAYKERPNMEGAPPEFKGREYEVRLKSNFYFAGLYDTWTSVDGESLDSCTVITRSSRGLDSLRAIWHERVPILLAETDCEEWLDPITSSERAFELCQPIGDEMLNVVELKN